MTTRRPKHAPPRGIQYAFYYYGGPNETGINPNINKYQFWNTSTTGYYQFDPRYEDYYNQRYYIGAPSFEYAPYKFLGSVLNYNGNLILPYAPALMDR